MCHFRRGFTDVNLYSDIVRHVLTGLKQANIVKEKKEGWVEQFRPYLIDTLPQLGWF